MSSMPGLPGLFVITHPMRRTPIGKAHCTYDEALKAACRSARRLNEAVHIKHWREGRRATVFPDGTIIDRSTTHA